MVHEYTCTGCAFRVRAEDDDTVIDLVREHARDVHDLQMSRGDVRDGWEEVEVTADD